MARDLKRICIIQPILTNYSHPVFMDMAAHCELDLLFSPSSKDSGFGKVERHVMPRLRYFMVPTLTPFGERVGMFQVGLIKYILHERPNAIFIFANLRYLSFWTTLACGRLLDIPVHAHGHGLYKKHRISFAYRLMNKLLLKFVTSYVCYAPIVRQSFLENGFADAKLTVAHNSLTNLAIVSPDEKTGRERGILFIGRLRPGSHMELLLNSMERIRQVDRIPLTLHVIGTGTESHLVDRYASDRDWIVLHGEVYDVDRIRQISLDCFAGCYPGNAGLSVVHMMSLSLPVVTHDDLKSHNGPEPSYVRDGTSGLLFDHKNPERSLYQALLLLATEPAKLAKMQRAAFEEYQEVVNPSLATRLLSILCQESLTPHAGPISAADCGCRARRSASRE